VLTLGLAGGILSYYRYQYLQKQLSATYYNNATNLYTNKDTVGAIDALENALKLDPANASARNLLIVILGEEARGNFDAGDYARAARYLQKLHKLLPQDQEVQSLLTQSEKNLASQ
jgi:cytochrome c-type biogenesis protein CcmH/NrfG